MARKRYKKKSKVWSWTKRKIRSTTKKAWTSHQRKAKKNRELKRKARSDTRQQKRVVATTNPDVEVSKGGFLDRHWRLANLKDGVAIRGHSWMDARELRSGVMTAEELDSFLALPSDASVEEWRAEMLNARRARYASQRARNRDGRERAPLTMVYGGGQQSLPQVKQVGFRPPSPRPSTSVKPVEPGWKVNPRPKVVRRRRNHIERTARQWQPLVSQHGRIAMAADANLSGAATAVQSFAEQFPESRTQLHDHLGKMAEFGKSYASAMDTFMSVLAQGKGEDNPGLPPEVINRLKPLGDVGEQIVQCCTEAVAAWEDYFADAIRVAQDEHTPSKGALTS